MKSKSKALGSSGQWAERAGEASEEIREGAKEQGFLARTHPSHLRRHVRDPIGIPGSSQSRDARSRARLHLAPCIVFKLLLSAPNLLFEIRPKRPIRAHLDHFHEAPRRWLLDRSRLLPLRALLYISKSSHRHLLARSNRRPCKPCGVATDE